MENFCSENNYWDIAELFSVSLISSCMLPGLRPDPRFIALVSVVDENLRHIIPRKPAIALMSMLFLFSVLKR